MSRSTLIAVFASSCMLFLALAAWFYLRGDRLLALVMLTMVPSEIGAAFVVDRVLSRQRQS